MSDRSRSQSFKGFETFSTAVKMNFKMLFYLCVGFLLVHCLIALCASYYFFAEQWSILVRYIIGSLVDFQMPSDAKAPVLSLLRHTFVFFAVSGAVWSLYPFALHYFAKRAGRQSADRYISGSRLLEETELAAQIKSDKEEVSLQFGRIVVPRSAEVKHTLIVGRPGSGKTLSISRNLEILKDRKVKLIIYDFKGDYVSKFYDPGMDIIFNPLDARGLDWNIFSEISIKTDIPAIAHSLIPPASQQDPFWNDAARAVFGGILHYLCQSNQRSNTAIWEMVSSKTEAITHILADIPEGREGYTYIQDGSSKQAMSVAAVLMQYTSCFQYMGPGDSSFAISSWLHDDRPGWIFVSNYADIQDTLRPVLSLFVDILSRKLLSMTDDYNRRIFFFLDEFGTLQRLSSIKNLLTLSRSKGGAVTIGIQDIGQLDKIYSPQLRQAIVNACGSSVMFAVSDPDTAEFLSRKIGEVEYSYIDENYSMGPEDMRDGLTLSRKEKTKRLFLPADLINLKDLECLVKLPNYHLSRTRIPYRSYPDINPPFVLRQGLKIENTASS